MNFKTLSFLIVLVLSSAVNALMLKVKDSMKKTGGFVSQAAHSDVFSLNSDLIQERMKAIKVEKVNLNELIRPSVNSFLSVRSKGKTKFAVDSTMTSKIKVSSNLDPTCFYFSTDCNLFKGFTVSKVCGVFNMGVGYQVRSFLVPNLKGYYFRGLGSLTDNITVNYNLGEMFDGQFYTTCLNGNKNALTSAAYSEGGSMFANSIKLNDGVNTSFNAYPKTKLYAYQFKKIRERNDCLEENDSYNEDIIEVTSDRYYNEYLISNQLASENLLNMLKSFNSITPGPQTKIIVIGTYSGRYLKQEYASRVTYCQLINVFSTITEMHLVENFEVCD